MKKNEIKHDDIAAYIEDKELIANKFILKSFWVVMLIYIAVFALNMLDIFIIDKTLMLKAFIPTLIIYTIVSIAAKHISLSNEKTKYFILSGIIVVFTITGVFLSYHAILITLLPFLYATLYSSKRVMRYVYFTTVISTIVIVYCGYFFGLCDANMVFLTTGTYQFHFIEHQIADAAINENPMYTLFLFFVVPRCLIYISFMAICNNINKMLSESLEKAKLTEELEKAKTAAEAANHAKSEFLARMSHEIRTPINAVMGMNEIIIRESGEDNIKQYAKDVQNSSEMLLSIINDILDSSKIESGMMEIVPVDYKTAGIFKDLYNITSVRAEKKDLGLIFDIAPDLPSVCYGDDKRIKQVFLNLLSNAVKYTHNGTVTLKVTCTREEENVTLHCAVIDTGIGIKEAVTQGIKRGLFTNEAGMGSSPAAHALSSSEDPHFQGTLGLAGVFIDTFLMLGITAIGIITVLYTGKAPPSGTLTGSEAVTLSVGSIFGVRGASVFIALSVLFFAFASVLGWNLYGKAAAAYLFGEKSERLYLISSLFFTFTGCIMPVKTVWLLTDVFNSLMVLTNAPALIRLSEKTRKFIPDNKKSC